jgi:cell cycle checkpoint protein
MQTLSPPPSSAESHVSSRQVVLLEDLPNILHPATAEAFHVILEEYVSSPSHGPLVFIVSDSGVRGEDPELDTVSWRNWARFGKETLDVRTIIPRTIVNSPYFQEIKWVF